MVNLAKISMLIFAHAWNFPFNLNIHFHARAKIVLENFAKFPKTAVPHSNFVVSTLQSRVLFFCYPAVTGNAFTTVVRSDLHRFTV
jgi:hypothetical protein